MTSSRIYKQPISPRNMSRSRKFVFTWNNPPLAALYEPTLEALATKYFCAGEEVAPTTGTPHLQGFIYFTHAKTVSAVRTLLPGCHVEAARGTPQECDKYCRKTRDVDPTPNAVVFSRGTLPLLPGEKGDLEITRWEDAWAAAKLGDLEAIPADIRVRQYSSLRRIERDYMAPVARLASTCGTWIVGESGCGKTRAVHDAFPEAYPKPRNQWWDGYQGEPVVLLDDIDKFNVALGGSLKHWADSYPFIGETKGSSKKIRPQRLIVTSQYRIEDIWADQETRDALLRRFVVIEKVLGQNIIL
ncbi:replication-associated protein [Antarctic virus 6_I_APBOOTsw001Ch]|nr:replication-associated protein [Antarctic virus 6_I_APBOOTsw001Ad]QNG41083.1 replication-associated protein [Antarctic virus 6_I_APBOOTsw001Ch]